MWLLEPGSQRMVALGVVDGGSAVLPVPAGVDLAAYSVVDVSVEPDDGDPAHSAVSVARGDL